MQDYQDDFSTRQWVAIMLQKLGMPRKAEFVLNATENQLQFYINLVKLLGNGNSDIEEILAYSGVA